MQQRSCDNTPEQKMRRCSGMIDTGLADLWKKRLVEYKDSGKSITAWCKGQGLTEGQYHYWRRKLGSEPAMINQPVKWVAVNMDVVTEEGKPADPITVHIGQFLVEVKPGFDENLLRNIFKVLKTV